MTSRWINALPRPLAFVFSGGANLGAIQVGMLKALHEEGFVPDLIVGTSVGALNGATIANHGMAGGIEILEEIWVGLNKDDIFPGGVWSQAMTLVRSWLHLYENSGLAKVIRHALTVDRLEDLATPFAVTATELVTHRSVLFTAGKIEPLLLASTSLPSIYPPVEIDGINYIDGGITNGTPMNSALSLGAKSMVVLDAGGNSCTPGDPPKHVAELLTTVLSSALRQKVLVEAPRIAQHLPVLFLPRPCTDGLSLVDFSSGRELMDEAYAMNCQFLAEAAVPRAGKMTGSPHSHQPEVDSALQMSMA
ncbi:MAG: patatin-like phospholipase family protein [Chloroflexota bacterium]